MIRTPSGTVPAGRRGTFRCLILSIAAKSSLTPLPSNLSMVSCRSVRTAQKVPRVPTKESPPISSAFLFSIGPLGPAEFIPWLERLLQGISAWALEEQVEPLVALGVHRRNVAVACNRRSSHGFSSRIRHLPQGLLFICLWGELGNLNRLHRLINRDHEVETGANLFPLPLRTREPA